MIIKVASLNLWDGGKLLPAALEFLKTTDADVVALQEVFDNKGVDLPDIYRSYEVLRQLGYPYRAFAPSFSYVFPDGNFLQGNAVLSKFPIQTSSARFLVEPTQEVYEYVSENFPLVARVLQRATVSTTIGEINLLNVHGVWDLDGNNNSPQRRRMVDMIIDEIAGKSNVIVTGDTNANATNTVWRPLEKHLASVFGEDLTTTFNMRRKDDPGYATAAVDLMFVSPNVKIVSKDVPDVDISDHLPLVVELEIT